MFLVGVVAALSHLPASLALTCPDGTWSKYTGGPTEKCYKQVTVDSNTHGATQKACALNTCEPLGASLPCVSSDAENAWLWSEFQDWLYLGLYQEPNHGIAFEKWDYWVDGCSSTYRKWDAEQPDAGTYTEACTFMGYTSALWHNVACSDGAPWSTTTQNYYAIQCVCQWPSSASSHYKCAAAALHDDTGTVQAACSTSASAGNSTAASGVGTSSAAQGTAAKLAGSLTLGFSGRRLEAAAGGRRRLLSEAQVRLFAQEGLKTALSVSSVVITAATNASAGSWTVDYEIPLAASPGASAQSLTTALNNLANTSSPDYASFERAGRTAVPALTLQTVAVAKAPVLLGAASTSMAPTTSAGDGAVTKDEANGACGPHRWGAPLSALVAIAARAASA